MRRFRMRQSLGFWLWLTALVVSVACFLTPGVSGQRAPTDVRRFRAMRNGLVQPVRKMRWHRLTIGFRGPQTNELRNPNPFTHYRLDVTFVHAATQRSYVVPGYYAADGDAANTGASNGNVWLVHFAPDLIGTWLWSASFLTGRQIAVQDQPDVGVSAGFFDGRTGNFTVIETDKIGGRDHRGKGRLGYVGKHHLQFANGEWFLKGGADSPENFLAYDDFDGTPNIEDRRKSWAPHLRDSRNNDPTWNGGKGKAIMGALNYLSFQKQMNAFSFITMNINGDDQNVFPYVSDQPAGFDRIDVSKMAQWEVLFSHADRVGLFMHFKTQETENDQLLDGGRLGNQRKLYYRELVARFSHHLALNWNLGEENSNTKVQRLAFARYFKLIDPYQHPTVIHTKPDAQSKERIFSGLVGSRDYNGASVQASQTDIFNDTLRWVQESDQELRPWVVTNDEQAGAGLGIVPDNSTEDPNHDAARENVLWANILAGGGGVEYYFGFRFPESDLTLQDFRSRDQFWDQTRYALRFFRDYRIAYWNMENFQLPNNPGIHCLADSLRNVLVAYLPNSRDPFRVDITGGPQSRFSVRWFDPRQGGRLQIGSIPRLPFGANQTVGTPPGGPGDEDWVLLLRRTNGVP